MPKELDYSTSLAPITASVSGSMTVSASTTPNINYKM